MAREPATGVPVAIHAELREVLDALDVLVGAVIALDLKLERLMAPMRYAEPTAEELAAFREAWAARFPTGRGAFFEGVGGFAGAPPRAPGEPPETPIEDAEAVRRVVALAKATEPTLRAKVR